jgi:acetolactate synthase regulatory subunit
MTRRPTHDHEPLEPAVAAELDALERALAGDPGADPDLAALVADVRADAPSMTDDFARSLDARVAAGFPREPRGAAAREALGRLRPTRLAWRPVLGVAASAIAALAVAVVLLQPEDRTTSVFGPADGSAPLTVQGSEGGGSSEAGGVATAPDAARESADEDSAAIAPAPQSSDSIAPAPPLDPGAGGADPGRLGGTRRVERSADLTLNTRPADVQAVSDRVVRTVQALGGVVASSRVSTSPDGGEATFDLRVPTARLDRTLRDLSKLAEVAALSQAADDITGAFTSAQDRLKDARDERAALLRALGRATTDRQVSSLRARIADSRRRISRAEADIRRLRNRTDTATVAVSVLGVEGNADEKEDGGGAWTPGDALDDALRVLEVAAGVAVVALAVLVPLGLLGLLVLLASRVARRRARERALDTTPAPPAAA